MNKHLKFADQSRLNSEDKERLTTSNVQSQTSAVDVLKALQKLPMNKRQLGNYNFSVEY